MAKQGKSSFAKIEAAEQDLLKEFNPLPKLVVFDLDFTLWPFQVDKLKPPLRQHSNGVAVDSVLNVCSLYPGVKDILTAMSNHSILAVASRIEDIASAYQMLQFCDATKYFPLKEIYPCSKSVHLKRLQRRSGVGFNEILFFDDDIRSIRLSNRIGIAAIQVVGGLSWNILKDGLCLYRDRNQNPI